SSFLVPDHFFEKRSIGISSLLSLNLFLRLLGWVKFGKRNFNIKKYEPCGKEKKVGLGSGGWYGSVTDFDETSMM
ncbi:MAG TPA: hypothetical protein VER35_03220, partial [Candidatus Limnocylindrales bacterium]|nr:hypothetical protein [Candidatus Limnocylindrales bacterium]